MSKPLTPRSRAKQRTERTERTSLSIDAGFQSDITCTLPYVTPEQRTQERAAPKAARRTRLTPETVAILKAEARQITSGTPSAPALGCG